MRVDASCRAIENLVSPIPENRRVSGVHQVVFPGEVETPDRQKLLGQLPEWAWSRVQSDGKCPEPEEFVEVARRRLEEMP